MKDLMKALWVLLSVAGDQQDGIDSEELQSHLDMCDGFLTEEEITFLSENSVVGVRSDTEHCEKVLWNRFSLYNKG